MQGFSSLDQMFADDDDTYSLLGLESGFDFSFDYPQMTPMPVV